jgi:hypothetical protein
LQQLFYIVIYQLIIEQCSYFTMIIISLSIELLQPIIKLLQLTKYL